MDVDQDGTCSLPEMSGFHDQVSNAIIAGLMSWVDSSISFAGEPPKAITVAFASNRSVLLNNVYVRGAKTLLDAPDGAPPVMPKNRSSWVLVKVLAHGQNPGANDGANLDQAALASHMTYIFCLPASRCVRWSP